MGHVPQHASRVRRETAISRRTAAIVWIDRIPGAARLAALAPGYPLSPLRGVIHTRTADALMGPYGRRYVLPSTHLCLHYHIVFSTKDRMPLIRDPARVHAYLGGVLKHLEATPLDIGGVKDHVHLLVGLKATHRLSDVLRTIKGESSRWIHEELGERKFGWQDGYAAFTVSRSLLDTVRRYVQNQEKHHRKRSFIDEYRELLAKHEIEFDERYFV